MAAPVESALNRLIAFSDGIFAVAITLLVLDLAVPDLGSQQTDAALQSRLVAEIPSVFSFLLSFVVVGIYWLSHHRLFQIAHEYGRGTLYANLLFLMTICFVPFPTGVLARYGQLRTAVIFYAASMAVTGFTLALLWWLTAVRPARRKPQRRVATYFTLRATGMSLVFLASIPLAFVSADYGRLTWIAIFPLYVVLGRMFGSEVRGDLRPGI
jgi:uncharacterized membrane protein